MILSLEEWINRYEEKTGDEFILPAGFQLYWLPNRGFAEYRLVDNILVVYQLCGDIAYWYDTACLLALQNNAVAVSTIATVPILPYLRLLHFEIMREEEKDGRKRFYCRDRLGRKVIATYHGTDDTGCDNYFVSSYMNELYEEEGEQHGEKERKLDDRPELHADRRGEKAMAASGRVRRRGYA